MTVPITYSPKLFTSFSSSIRRTLEIACPPVISEESPTTILYNNENISLTTSAHNLISYIANFVAFFIYSTLALWAMKPVCMMNLM